MKKICVFAGSSIGVKASFEEHACQLAQELVKRELGLVYGGSMNGLMGVVANEMLRLGGDVTGIMPKGLFKKEIVHQGITTFIEVDSMHERKARMHELSDGFIALPGGFGTFEELFEAITWAQIKIHSKKIGILNISNYYTPLLELANHTVREGFVSPQHLQLFTAAETAEVLLDKMEL